MFAKTRRAAPRVFWWALSRALRILPALHATFVAFLRALANSCVLCAVALEIFVDAAQRATATTTTDPELSTWLLRPLSARRHASRSELVLPRRVDCGETHAFVPRAHLSARDENIHPH